MHDIAGPVHHTTHTCAMALPIHTPCPPCSLRSVQLCKVAGVDLLVQRPRAVEHGHINSGLTKGSDDILLHLGAHSGHAAGSKRGSCLRVTSKQAAQQGKLHVAAMSAA